MKSQAAIILAYALSSLSPISGLDIDNWDVLAYVKDDGNATAFAYQGDTVTWTGTGSDMTYQFDTEEDYDSCDFMNATHLDNDVTTIFESWPAGIDYKERAKGARFFGYCDTDVCENCSKIKIVFKPKKFIGTKKKECSTGVVLAFDDSGKGGFGKCQKVCKQAPGCMGFQFKKEKGALECTTYSTIPEAGSSSIKGPSGCYGVKPLNVPKP
jgi:hypothetical protein